MSIFDAMQRFFDEDGWPTRRVEPDGPTLVTGFRGASGNWTCVAVAVEDQQQFLFYSVAPINAPAESHAAVAEYLTRANYGLHVGNFELDYRDGEIRFKTSVDVEGASLVASLVRNLVYLNCLMMDRYLPGLLGVIHAGEAPADAIAKAEAPVR